jgi:hypothetical protein
MWKSVRTVEVRISVFFRWLLYFNNIVSLWQSRVKLEIAIEGRSRAQAGISCDLPRLDNEIVWTGSTPVACDRAELVCMQDTALAYRAAIRRSNHCKGSRNVSPWHCARLAPASESVSTQFVASKGNNPKCNVSKRNLERTPRITPVNSANAFRIGAEMIAGDILGNTTFFYSSKTGLKPSETIQPSIHQRPVFGCQYISHIKLSSHGQENDRISQIRHRHLKKLQVSMLGGAFPQRLLTVSGQ